VKQQNNQGSSTAKSKLSDNKIKRFSLYSLNTPLSWSLFLPAQFIPKQKLKNTPQKSNMEPKHDAFNMNLLFKGVQFCPFKFQAISNLLMPLGIPTSKKPFLPSINGCGSRGLDPRVTNCLNPHLASQPWRTKGRCEFLANEGRQGLLYQRSKLGVRFLQNKMVGGWENASPILMKLLKRFVKKIIRLFGCFLNGGTHKTPQNDHV